MLDYELSLWDKGLVVAGVDEAGRGPLAGPVVAAAVILPPYTEPFIGGDSKKMSPREREEAYEEIKKRAIAIGTAVVDSAVIDRINILRATKLAMKRALEDLKRDYDVVISDYIKIEGVNCIAIPKGDERSLSCACASVVAKVLRDRIMEIYDRVFPGFGFAKNKGYPSKNHIKAVEEGNYTEIHRQTFSPLKKKLF